MPTFMPDSSVMVPVLSSWHAAHQSSVDAVQGRLSQGETMIVAGRTLIETFSVLTRLPQGKRLSPQDAFAMIEPSFVTGVRTVAVPASGYRQILEEASASGVAGGRMHDAEIAYCAVAAAVDALVTFNERRFAGFRGLASKISVPIL